MEATTRPEMEATTTRSRRRVVVVAGRVVAVAFVESSRAICLWRSRLVSKVAMKDDLLQRLIVFYSFSWQRHFPFQTQQQQQQQPSLVQ